MLLAELARLEAQVDQLQRSRDAVSTYLGCLPGAGAAAAAPRRARAAPPEPTRARDSAAAWVGVLRAREGGEA